MTGAGHTIQAPWGSFPGYLSLIQEDFQRANEKAVLVGAAYDFSKLVTPGLSAFANVAWGWDAIDPKTRAAAPDQTEYDLTVDYRPPWLRPAFLQGMWLRVRGVILDQEGASTRLPGSPDPQLGAGPPVMRVDREAATGLER